MKRLFKIGIFAFWAVFLTLAENDKLYGYGIGQQDTLRTRTVTNLSAVATDNRTGAMFSGGEADGFSTSCLLPRIIFQSTSEITCVTDSIVFELFAEGSGLEYKWQKLGLNGFADIPADGSRITGLNTDRLVLHSILKSKDDGIYRCLVKNDCGGVATDSIRVNINSIPKITAGMNKLMTYICASSREMTLTTAVSSPNKDLLYTWSRTDTTTGRVYTFPLDKNNNPYLKFEPTDRSYEGLYIVKIGNQCGEVSDSVYLPVYMPVSIDYVNFDENHQIVACRGENVKLRATLGGGGAYTYVLKKVKRKTLIPLTYEVERLVDTAKSEVMIETVTKADEGYYVWEVTNECGRDTSELIYLKVYESPVFKQEMPDTLFCEGAKLDLKCAAEGEGIEYYWRHNGELVGVNSNVLTLDPLKEEDAGMYVCYAHNVCERHVASRNVRVKVDPRPQFLRDPYLVRPACVGDSVVDFGLVYAGVQVDSMRWHLDFDPLYDDGKVFDGTTKDRLSVYNIKDEQRGVYFVKAYNHCGVTISKAVELNQLGRAPIIRSAFGGKTMLLCAGKDQKLMVDVDGDGPLHYRWICGKEIIAESDTNFTEISSGHVNDTALYCVHVQNVCGSAEECAKLNIARIEPYPVIGGGMYCDGHQTAGEVILPKSDPDIVYTVYREPDEKVTEFKGSRDTLRLEDQPAGIYYITGRDSNNCVQRMDNTVEVKLYHSPLAGRFFISKQNCVNNLGAELMQMEWEENVQYYLWRQMADGNWDKYKGQRFTGGYPGTGSPAKGEVKIWSGIEPGRYKIIATDPQSPLKCTREILLDDSVEMHLAPAKYNLRSENDRWINCSLETDQITLYSDGFEKNSKYTLKKNDTQFGQVLKSTPIEWGHIEAGEYQLVVENEWGCTTESAKVRVSDGTSPRQIRLAGNGAICQGDTDPYKELMIVNSEANVSYKIYREFPDTYIGEIKGNGGVTSPYKLQANKASYYIVATDPTGKCSLRMEENFVIGVSDFTARTVPSEVFLDKGSRTRLHLEVQGNYSMPIVIEWKPRNKIEWGLVSNPNTQVHKQYYKPFCPCKCTNYSYNNHQYSHGPGCNELNCPYLYHTWDPKKNGCVYQGTETILYEGRKVPYYDLYYCRKQVSDGGQVDSEQGLDPNPFKDPLTVPIYEDTRYEVTMTDHVGCSVTDYVDVKVTGKRLQTMITQLGVHKHYNEPFCPCGCRVISGSIIRNHYTHSQGCKDPTCWSFYHSHKHKGYTWQGAPTVIYEGQSRKYYDLYYYNSGIAAEDTIVFKNNKLVFYSTTSGGDYKYTYKWSFVGEDGSISPIGFRGDSVNFIARNSGCLYLDVFSMGQHSRDSVWIEVEKKPLVAEIRDANCKYRLDTMRICRGDAIELCGWANGGDGPQTYRWYDEKGDLESANHLIYTPQNSGKVWFSVFSDGVPAMDSVVIKIIERPQKLAVEDPGVRCVQMGDVVKIKVPKTEVGLDYILEYGGKSREYQEYGQNFYNVGGRAVTFEIKNPLLEAGIYRVRVDRVNQEKTCSAYLDEVEILKPATEVIIEDTSFCKDDPGLVIRLKSVDENMRYSICLPDGKVLDSIVAPALVFSRPLQIGDYIFRSERTGFLGTCKSEKPLTVVNIPDPDVTLAIDVNSNGRVCAGEEILVTVKNTEKDVLYELLNPRTQKIASFIGTGADQKFENLNKQEEGKYLIRATREGCSVYLDNAVKVNSLPRNLSVRDASYCHAYASSPNSSSVPIDLEHLQADVTYRLYRDKQLVTTISGPGTVPVNDLVAGNYQIEGENQLTGCLSRVGEFAVTARKAPAIFDIGQDCGARVEVKLRNSEDSVAYDLYRDEELMNTLQGNGQPLNFGMQTVSGIYKVLATNTKSGCEQWMDGSIAIYQLDTCSPQVRGVVCEGSDIRFGVDIYYPCSRMGWTYYIKKIGTTLVTNKQAGTGGELWWSNFGKRPIREGIYQLWAERDCDTVMVKEINIELRPMIKGVLQPISASVCWNEYIELSVMNAIAGIKYTLSTPIDGYEKTLSEKKAEEDALSLGRFRNYDLYRLSGAYEDGACATSLGELGELYVRNKVTPERIDILGSDVCESLGTTIQLCLPEGSKETGTDYYLCNDALDGKDVDSLTSGYHSSNYCFDPQKQVGCYYVMGYNTSSACRDTMNGTYCLGAQPKSRHVRVDTNRLAVTEANLCTGQSVWIMMDSTELGVKYVLMKDGVPYGTPVTGTGDVRPKRIGCVGETGLYTVRAFNGCEATMLDTIKIKVGEPTEMVVRKNYYYCSPDPTDPGAVIEVYNAEKNCKFELWSGKYGGTLLDTQVAAHTGDTVRFQNTYRDEGDYYITALSVWGCFEQVPIQVKRDSFPDMQKVISSTGNNMCEQGCTEISLQRVQTDVEYRLMNADTGQEEDFFLGGFGQTTFNTICFPGTYYVDATRYYYPRCSREMDGRIVLSKIDTIREFRITVVDSVYCMGDIDMATITMSGSEAKVEYELYRDGQPTGLTRRPNTAGTPVMWRQVKGKLASGLATGDAGYVYSVKARKDNPKCEKFMINEVRVIEEEPIEILAFDPEYNQELCEGKAMRFNVIATGQELQYSWFRGATMLVPVTPELILDSLTTDDFGIYTCQVKNTCGMKIAGPVELKVMPGVSLDEPIKDVTLCEGKPAYIFSRMSNVHAGNYRWYREDAPDHILSKESYLAISSIRIADVGRYICQGISACDTVTDDFRIFVEQNIDSLKVKKLIDTICVAAPWHIRIDPLANKMRWLKDGMETGVEGHVFDLAAVTKSDEGIYSVAYGNACGERISAVRQLLVDDTVKVLAFTDARMICGGAPLDLFIKTVPRERVHYAWYEGTQPIGTGEKITVTPKGEQGQRTYRVRYSNKCTDEYASVKMSLSRNVTMENPPKSIRLCATPGLDTSLCVKVNGTDVLNYKWLFNRSGNSGKADTLSRQSCQQLDVSSNSTGYYYCTMETECGRLNSETSWVVIDSMPSIRGMRQRDTLCEGGYVELSASALGGSLVYTWELLLKDGSAPQELKKTEGLDFISSTSYVLGPVTYEYDGAIIRCIARNSCAADTMETLLFVDKARFVEISPDEVRICEGSDTKITVELKNGVAPWSYKYAYEDENEIARFPGQLKDELEVSRAGTYRILYMRDGSRCMYQDTLAKFTVTTQPLTTAILSTLGRDTLCRGDQAQIRIEVRNGIGPWEVAVLKSDGREALEIGKPSPFYIYEDERNMTISFPINESEVYYLGGIKDMAQSTGVTCQGNILDSARFVVLGFDTLRFTFNQDTFGYCRPVKLDTLLKPNMPGSFYIDGAKSQSGLFNPAAPRMELGEHTIEYKTTGRCPAGNNKVKLWIEDKPKLHVVPRDTGLCPGESMNVILRPEGKGPFELTYAIHGVKSNGSIEVLEKNPLKNWMGQKTINVYNPGNGTDSIRRIVPVSLIDKYGCWADRVDSIESNVFLRRYPDFEVYGRHKYYNSGNWAEWIDPYIIPEGDTVAFKVELKSGERPWAFNLLISGTESITKDITNIHGRDTIYETTASGEYKFRVVDGDNCTKPNGMKTKHIYFKEDGYFMAKVLLEGPYDASTRKMGTYLYDNHLLPQYTGMDWTVLGGKKVIDWLIVEAREQENSEPVSRDTVLVREDGVLLNPATGRDTLTLRNTSKLWGNDLYYIVLRHRNHLSVMSGRKVLVADADHKDQVVFLDFTTGNEVTPDNVYSSGAALDMHMTRLEPGKWAMAAGYDLVIDELVSVTNPNATKHATERSTQYKGYYLLDVNFDGIVQWPQGVNPGDNIFDASNSALFKSKDAWIVQKNRNKYSAVPAVGK